MHALALTAACLAPLSYGLRTPSFNVNTMGGWQLPAGANSDEQAVARRDLNPSEVFTRLLLALDPAASFRSHNTGMHFAGAAATPLSSSPTVLDRHNGLSHSIPPHMPSDQQILTTAAAIPHRARAGNAVMLQLFNLGSTEALVVGVVAYVVLGPKELYRLSKEAGTFFAQFQEIANEAKAALLDGVEAEMSAEEKYARERARAAGLPEPEPQNNFGKEVLDAFRTGTNPATEFMNNFQSAVSSQLDTRADKYDQYKSGYLNQNDFKYEEDKEQTDEQPLSEYPSELSAPSSALDPVLKDPVQEELPEDEAELKSQISEAEDELAALQAEKQLLALKRKQLEAAAERAQPQEEELTHADKSTTEKVEASKDTVQ
mmetsp:Transcript_59993/g.113011  ORF Transcript_59993/g.113011 Transcript_59993/m.113011 type:complete len:374 (-) Transcript_59993:148-1269(-)